MDVQIIPASRGVRHTASWAAGERPTIARQGMMFLYPNGEMPLTALLSMMSSKKPPQARFEDYTKNFPTQAGDISSVKTADGSSFSAVNASPGRVLRIICDDSTSLEMRKDHVVLLRNEDDSRNDVACDVVEVEEDGSTSVVTVKTIETIYNDTTKANPALATRILIIGTAQEEGAGMPDVVNYSPISMWNYCQIFETAYEITGTQLAEENLLTGDPWKEEKREKFELHGIEMEKAFLFGRRYEKLVNGKPKRYTMGMIPMIQEYAPQNVFRAHLSTDARFAGKEWEEYGIDYFDMAFEEISRYGGMERICLCGSSARVGLTRLLRANGFAELKTYQAEYGFWVETWAHNGIKLHIKTHPLFSQERTNRNMMVIFEAKNLVEHPLRQTHSKKRPEGEVDGKKESWLTETGLFFKFPPAFAIIDGVGKDNEQVAA